MAETKHTKAFYNSEIPEGWSISHLGDLGTFSKGKGILKEQVIPEGLPCIRYGEIYTTHDFIIKNFKSFISKDVATESKEIKNGDILFAGSGETVEEIGKAVAYVGTDKAYAGGDVIILSTKININPECLSYALETDFVKRQKRVLGQGNSVVHIYSSDLSKVKIPLPPLPEQRAIAQVLSTADAAIHTTEKLIAQKELRKKWLMQQLLNGKKRLNGFEGEWKRIMLGDIGEIKTSSVDKVFLEEERIVNLVNYMDVYKNRFITPEFECKKTSANEREINTFNLRKGDILFTPSSETPDDIGHSAVVTADLENTVYSYHLVRFRLFQETTLSYNFRAYVFNNQNILSEFSRRATGSTRFTISKSDFEEIETKIPPTHEEQTAIAQVLQAADKEISLLKTKAEKLRDQKKGLMQQLLSGKKRIKV